MGKLNELVIGEKVTGQFVVLKNISNLITNKDGSSGYVLTLSDKTGEVTGYSRKELITEDILSSVKGPIKISAVVKPGKDRKPELVIKEICKAKSGEYKSSDLFDGLSAEKIAEYKAILNGLKKFIKHPGYKALIEICLTDETLDRLAVMPASLAYYGKYKGGALAGAALISMMAKSTGVEYVKHHNALHQTNLNWDLILTASMLNTYGVVDYFTQEEPFRKTSVGVERGYFSVLQSKLERLVITNALPISDEELSKLFNVLAASMQRRTEIKATSKEGIILRHCVAMYSELDMLDYGVEQDKTEDADEVGYFYNTMLHRYVAS